MIAELPSRRTEGWRWSDLRAVADSARMLREASHPIEALAGETATLMIAPGESRVITHEVLGAHATDIVVLAGASATRIVIQSSAEGLALDLARVRLEEGAVYRQFILAEGAKLARIETHVDVQGEGAEVELNGVYMVGDDRHADLTSIVTHHVAGATTKQLIKGVARKGGRGVFQGKIEVTRHAQKTDARQHHAGLMLEEGAEIFAKPELMIFADDVSCGHGNTIGALDGEALFYLRSRGISKAAARALLIEAFLGEAVSETLPDAVRGEAFERIRRWLGVES
jgi:Fe-S cluster assembly protein SufD